MSQASSSARTGDLIFGTDESVRPPNWPLIVGVAVAGLALMIWLVTRK